MMFLSVIVDDFYVCGSFCRPNKADAPLLVDANAVLPLSIILQRFEAVARRHFQVVKNGRPVQLCKLSQGMAFNIDPALNAFTLEECLCVFALEVFDRHGWR